MLIEAHICIAIIDRSPLKTTLFNKLPVVFSTLCYKGFWRYMSIEVGCSKSNPLHSLCPPPYRIANDLEDVAVSQIVARIVNFT